MILSRYRVDDFHFQHFLLTFTSHLKTLSIIISLYFLTPFRNNPSAKSFYINKLSPTSDYDVFITDCERNNELSTRVNVQTMRDGKLFISKNFLSLSWKEGYCE